MPRAPAADCSATAITRDTGIAIAWVAFCDAGWNIAVEPRCLEGDEAECEDARAFHISNAGWVDAGTVYPFCPDHLPQVGMTIFTALAFASRVCDPSSGIDPAAPRTELRPGDTGAETRALQIALVAEGYRLELDGTFGPRTETALRDFQAVNGIPVTGTAGARTRVALGM